MSCLSGVCSVIVHACAPACVHTTAWPRRSCATVTATGATASRCKPSIHQPVSDCGALRPPPWHAAWLARPWPGYTAPMRHVHAEHSPADCQHRVLQRASMSRAAEAATLPASPALCLAASQSALCWCVAQMTLLKQALAAAYNETGCLEVYIGKLWRVLGVAYEKCMGHNTVMDI